MKKRSLEDSVKPVVLNRCYGRFDLSEDAVELYGKLKGLGGEPVCSRSIPRDDPCLVQVVRELGELANGNVSRLEIVLIEDRVDWEIVQNDGVEWLVQGDSGTE